MKSLGFALGLMRQTKTPFANICPAIPTICTEINNY